MTGPRVLLVTKGLDLGGLERVVVDLAVAMRRRGVGVEVALVNESRAALAGALVDAGVPLHRLGGSDTIGAGVTARLARIVALGRFDVVHAHGPLVSAMTRLASRSTPVLSTVHTVWQAMHPATRIAWLATEPLERATVAVSDVVARSLPSRIAARTRVIPHGVDPRAIAAALAASDRVADDRPGLRAITVASHRPAKGYPTLLRAVRQARDAGVDVRLLAVGEGPDLAQHQSLASRLGLTGVVDFVAPTPHVLTLIAESDLLVVASGFEGQPIVVVEALALGRPVIATSVGRVPELVSQGVGRVVGPGDTAGLAAALVELGSQPDVRHQMHEAATRVAVWTTDDVVDSYLPLYVRLADGDGSHRSLPPRRGWAD